MTKITENTLTLIPTQTLAPTISQIFRTASIRTASFRLASCYPHSPLVCILSIPLAWVVYRSYSLPRYTLCLVPSITLIIIAWLNQHHLHLARPNHLNLHFLITKLTDSKPSNTLHSICSFNINPLIQLIMCISFLPNCTSWINPIRYWRHFHCEIFKPTIQSVRILTKIYAIKVLCELHMKCKNVKVSKTVILRQGYVH